MDKKVLFNETLTSLVEFAAAKGNEITTEDVQLYFKDLIEDDSQYKFIYDYLAINKIKVDGFDAAMEDSIFSDVSSSDDTSAQETVTATTSEETETERLFIQMYQEDMEKIPPIQDGEVAELVKSLVQNDLSAVERLVECHLSTVFEIAGNYRGQGVAFGDLIQEGNVGLMLAISDYHSGTGAFDDFIRSRVTDAIESTINSQIHSDRIGNRLADKLNQLDAVTADLSEKLGRVPEIKELAEAMSISEEEVSLLLKTSLDTLSVNEDTQITGPGTNDAETGSSSNDPLEWRINKK